MTDDALCPVCTDGLPAPVICTRCTNRIRRDLDTVGQLRSQLDPTPGRSGPTGRAAGKPGSKPPADLSVIAMTDARSHFGWYHCGHDPADEPCPNPRCGGEPDPDNVANVDADLLTEARWVIEERRLHPPMRDAFDSLRVLNIHFDWIARHPRADEFAAVIAACAAGLRSALSDWPERPLGKCPDIDPRGEADTCGGPLRWVDGTTAVACGRCGSTWAEADLANFLRVVQPTRRFPVPRSWVATRYGIEAATLRQWVRRGHVRSYHDEQVDLFDVLARISGEETA